MRDGVARLQDAMNQAQDILANLQDGLKRMDDIVNNMRMGRAVPAREEGGIARTDEVEVLAIEDVKRT